MNKISFLLLTAVVVLVVACQNTTSTDKPGKTKADTLGTQIEDEHMVGMGKMGQLTKAQQKINYLLDSISKLPAKAQVAAAPYKAKLSGLLEELNAANTSMESWMHNFKWDWDSVYKNTEDKIRYLEPEKEKAVKVKDAVVSSLQKADSVLRSKF
jgi:hypothetical protein